MAAAAILGVHLIGAGGETTRVGTLSRAQDGATAFIVDEAYLRDPGRPILSLSWFSPEDDEVSRARLVDRRGKIGLNGTLPPWFSGLLPEGSLRELVIQEMGPGDHDQFDVLMRLGADLPGAVLIVPETATPASAGPLRLERVHGFEAPLPEGVVKFSLAGVQLKFAVTDQGDRLTAPARAGDSRYILKVASDRYPLIPQAEYAAMELARAAGVDTAPCRLVPIDQVDGIPEGLLGHGDQALAVARFDRNAEGGRLHMEDAAQILGALGERKYTMGTTETVLNMIRRFSTDWRADVLEGLRRLVVDVLIGNGDNHLKNWSFIFPEPGEIRLSPAYDIVPTVLYIPHDSLALRFAGTHNFENVGMRRIRRVAQFLGLDADWIQREVAAMVNQALGGWPEMMDQLLGERSVQLKERFQRLQLVAEVRA